MSGLFGGGGSKGFTEPTTVDIPPFLSSGGVTPQQSDLAEYSYGENLLGEANLFGQSGTGQSTMATQGAGGAAMQKAADLGKMSDTDQAAQYALYGQDLSGLENNLNTQTTLDQIAQTANQQATSGLVSGLGSLAGLGAKTGGFGTNTGTFNTAGATP